MRILLLTHSFNSLAQRLHVALTERGHELAVELDINDATTTEAVDLFRPHLIVAPFLKRRIPTAVFQSTTCMIVHPGPPGDRGPTALDWAVLRGEKRWGVTVLQAEEELDAGPVWSWREFPMREARKSSLYRFEVTEAATDAVLEAVAAYEANGKPTPPGRIARAWRHHWRDAVRGEDRRIDWRHDDTATVLRTIRSADGRPGVLDNISGMACRVFDAHPEGTLAGPPGTILARRDGGICRATKDGAIWIGQLMPEANQSFKLPATTVLKDRLDLVPESTLPFHASPERPTWQPIHYREAGDIGYLHFDFYNGAMGTAQCRDLLEAFRFARERDTRVIVLMGGSDFWSNGLDLNLIEAAESPADESWRNIQAMDDLCEAIITTTSHVTLAALRGNAGAGGVFLALGADQVLARDGVILNPHYKNMGNLYGSEYWTYLLPRRVGRERAAEVLAHRLPLGTGEAARLGLVDDIGPGEQASFARTIRDLASGLAKDHASLIRDKARQRARDEAAKPLAAYREEELERMHLNFYGFDPSYHVARYRFVHRTPHAWTPLYLAPHRQLGWRQPENDNHRAQA